MGRPAPRAATLIALLAGVVVVAALSPLALAAQERALITLDGKEPKRPRLPAGADTNDARAYNDYADARDTPWKRSFDGYYWALRVAPDANYYRLKLANAVLYSQSWDWQRERENGAEFVVKSKESRLIDTLVTLAYYRNPFENLFANECRLDRDTYEFLKDDLFWNAQYFYERGCYQRAAQAWVPYLAKNPGALNARLKLVRSYYWTRQYGNALQQIDIALDTLRARDAKRTYRFLISKEVLETMRGDIYEAQEDYFNAKKAYGRALEENLTYWPAHVRLARAALAQNERDEALQEFAQAVQLAPDEVTLRYEYGDALLGAGKLPEAEAELRKAIALEPEYALPYLSLARTLDRQKKLDDAMPYYRQYLARAPKWQNRLIVATQQRVNGAPTIVVESK